MRKRVLLVVSFTLVIAITITACGIEVKRKERKAREYFKKNQYRKVVEILNTIPQEKRPVSVSILLGKAYCIQFEFEKGDQAFRSSCERYPAAKDTILHAYILMAERFNKRKREDLAIKAYTSILEMESEFNIENGFYTLGHFYLSRNDLLRAMEMYEKGVETISDERILRETKVELMDVYEELGKLKKAIEISAEDLSKDIIYRRGKISYKLAKDFFAEKVYDSALIYCESLLVISTPRPLIDDTYFLMGEIYSSQGNYTDAVKYYKEVLKLDRFGNSELAAIAKKKVEILTQYKGGW
jgi:tetratricopeptide (TPR) repeat protein